VNTLFSLFNSSFDPEIERRIKLKEKQIILHNIFLNIVSKFYYKEINFYKTVCPYCGKLHKKAKLKVESPNPIFNPIGKNKLSLFKCSTLWDHWCSCGKEFIVEEYNMAYRTNHFKPPFHLEISSGCTVDDIYGPRLMKYRKKLTEEKRLKSLEKYPWFVR